MPRINRTVSSSSSRFFNCGLTALLAAEEAFGLSAEEIDALLEPSLYIGRCPEQVEAFLAKYAPFWEGAEAAASEISL